MSIIRNGFQSADLDVPVVSPTLNLDFANSQELDPRITFSRGSIGTFVNKNGLIETAPANQPRFDYDPISGECGGLLIEESRTNLVTNSENFSSWGTSYRTTISLNAAISPSGQLNASKFNVTTDTGYHARSLAVTGGTYMVSIFAKAGEYNGIQITGTNTTEDHACFNLVNGTAYHSGTNVTNKKIENFGNGWYRCSARLPLTNGFLFVAITDGTTTSWLPSFTGSNATDGIYIWGAQVEAGAFPTSYIPTSGSTVTRSADNADMTGSNFTSWANSSVGTFVIRGRGGQSTSQTLRGRFVGIGVGGAISLEGAGTTVGIWDTTNSFTVTNNSADVVNRNSNIAASFDGTLRRIVLNGVASSGISRRNINTIFTQISLGKNGNNSNYLNGTLSRVAYYPRQLNDAQMLYLTT